MCLLPYVSHKLFKLNSNAAALNIILDICIFKRQKKEPSQFQVLKNEKYFSLHTLGRPWPSWVNCVIITQVNDDDDIQLVVGHALNDFAQSAVFSSYCAK